MHHNGRYDVVRSADGYAVIDLQRKHVTVYTSHSRKAAHTKAERLNQAAESDRFEHPEITVAREED
jgi:hypothetical protein